MGRHAIHFSSINHYNMSLSMTKTNTGENEKFNRNVPEESVVAVYIINSTLKTLSMIAECLP